MNTKWYPYSTPPYLDLPDEDEDEENEKKNMMKTFLKRIDKCYLKKI